MSNWNESIPHWAGKIRITPHDDYQEQILREEFIQARNPVLTPAVLIFGPAHGTSFEVNVSNIKNQHGHIMVPDCDDPNFDMFQPLEGIPAMASTRLRTHKYVLHDVVDQGLEEVAIFIHDEDCCNKTIPDQETDRYRKARKAFRDIY